MEGVENHVTRTKDQMKERVVAMRLFAAFAAGAGCARWRQSAVIAAGAAAFVATPPATAGASGGSPLYVNTAGTDAGTCTFADPCATITHALSLAVNGSKIHVASGTYDEQLVIRQERVDRRFREQVEPHYPRSLDPADVGQ